MAYDLAKMSMTALMGPAFDAGIALTRLDERIARSPVGRGFLERSQFTDACASLWIDGELVHLEDLALHDATHDIRTPDPRTDHRPRCSTNAPAHWRSSRRIGRYRQRVSELCDRASDSNPVGAEAVEPAGVIRSAVAH